MPRTLKSASIVSARSCIIFGVRLVGESPTHLQENYGPHCTRSTALVSRRMNKLQQMRWSRRGADLLLQVRCAIHNGNLGSGFGQKFRPANDPHPQAAIAA
jgi:hypothetical protein